ncbi:MAG: 3-deoxy-D-manno-octulosonic acid transferase [Hyphomonas sp.]|jgi:3-deoxy-D-manno-octulosonic-acid transferase
MTPALFTYQLATRAAAPVLGLMLQARASKGKEDFLRLNERLARRLPPRRPGPLVWLHGASVGESRVLLELGRRLIAERPGVLLLFTSQTLTSARLMGKEIPESAIHSMAPVDTPMAARRFMQHWRPDLCIFAEGEIWPNLITEAGRAGARRALVNARMTDESAKGWTRVKGLFRELIGGFDVVLAADAETGARLEGLLGRAVRVPGNLKSAQSPPAANPVEQARLSAAFINGRRCFVAASTHPGEEELFLDATERLTDAALIIVPRHPDRGDEIAMLLKSRRLPFARRSKGETAGPRDRVILADTMGEMGLWLRLADVVYLGGGHTEGVGGHNPLEPVRLRKPVLTGPHIFNFASMMADLSARGLVRTVTDAGDLAAGLTDPPIVHEQAVASLEAEADAPMLATLAALLPLIPRPLLETAEPRL